MLQNGFIYYDSEVYKHLHLSRQNEPDFLSISLKVCPHQAKAKAKVKKIKEQSEEIKEQTANIKEKFRFRLV